MFLGTFLICPFSLSQPIKRTPEPFPNKVGSLLVYLPSLKCEGASSLLSALSRKKTGGLRELGSYILAFS